MLWLADPETCALFVTTYKHPQQADTLGFCSVERRLKLIAHLHQLANLSHDATLLSNRR